MEIVRQRKKKMLYSPKAMSYISLNGSITSICKSILPFRFKKSRLPAVLGAQKRLSDRQSDNLKWQQYSFHQVLKLMALSKDGILPETEVFAFRSHILETLVALPFNQRQHPIILRDKLIFLQELLNAKCISEEEYNEWKRPLMQGVASKGAEIGEDLIIDKKSKRGLLGEEDGFISKKQIKGFRSVFSFKSSHKKGNSKEDRRPYDKFRNEEMLRAPRIMYYPREYESEKQRMRKEPFGTLHQQKEGNWNGDGKTDVELDGKGSKSGKNHGFKKLKKTDSDDETTPLSLGEKSDRGSSAARLVDEEEEDNKQIKKKLFSDGLPSEMLIVDKVLGADKREASQIQTCFGPKGQIASNSLCKVTMEMMKSEANEKNHCELIEWTTFDDEENHQPNHYAGMKQKQKQQRQQQHPNLFDGINQQQHCTTKAWVTFDNEANHPYNPFVY